jgi:hypothetical protein
MDRDSDLEPHVLQALEPGEELRQRARATDAVLALTDRRLFVAAPERVALAIPFDGLRRIQFDIERHRPATLVIVPEMANHEPQVLSIPPEQYPAAGELLAAVGRELAELERTG